MKVIADCKMHTPTKDSAIYLTIGACIDWHAAQKPCIETLCMRVRVSRVLLCIKSLVLDGFRRTPASSNLFGMDERAVQAHAWVLSRCSDRRGEEAEGPPSNLGWRRDAHESSCARRRGMWCRQSRRARAGLLAPSSMHENIHLQLTDKPAPARGQGPGWGCGA